VRRIRAQEKGKTLQMEYEDGRIKFTIRSDGSAVITTATVDAVVLSHRLEQEMRQA
jgi:hypothetical protein